MTVILCFISLNVYAQHNEAVCGVVAFSETLDSTQIDLYIWQDGEYSFAESMAIPENSVVRQTTHSTEFSGIAIYNLNDRDASFTDLYKATLAGFEDIGEISASSDYSVAPRLDPFSYNGRFLSLQNTFDTRNNRLIIFDTENGNFLEPTDLTEVFDVAWSPSRNTIAFVAYDAIFDGESMTNEVSDFGVYISDPEGTTSRMITVEQEGFARFHWINDNELAITSCTKDGCNSIIYILSEDTTNVWDFGDYLLEDYIGSRDSFLLSRIEDRNLFLTDRNGNLTQVSQVDRVLSRPLISSDERYISFRARVSDEYNLYVIDMENSFTSQILELSSEMPELLASNTRSSFQYDLTFYTDFDVWNPNENTLLYADNNRISIFDPQVGLSSIVIENNSVERRWKPRWVCSNDQ